MLEIMRDILIYVYLYVCLANPDPDRGGINVRSVIEQISGEPCHQLSEHENQELEGVLSTMEATSPPVDNDPLHPAQVRISLL